MPNSTSEKTYALVFSPLNKRLAARIEASGSRVIQFPQVETEKIGSDEKASVSALDWVNFDWLIFNTVWVSNFYSFIFSHFYFLRSFFRVEHIYPVNFLILFLVVLI